MGQRWILGLVGACAVVGIAVGVRQLAAQLSELDGRIDGLDSALVALRERCDACERALATPSLAEPKLRPTSTSRVEVGMPLNGCIQLLGDPDEAFEAIDHIDAGYHYQWDKFDWKTYLTGVPREYECSDKFHHRLAVMMEGSSVHLDFYAEDSGFSPIALQWDNVTVFFDRQKIARHIFVAPTATTKP